MTAPYKLALIVGAGAGLSASLARRLTKAGLVVALAARETDKMKPLCAETRAKAFRCDAQDQTQVASLSLKALSRQVGSPDVLIYNASARARGPFAALNPDEVRKTLMVTAFGAFLVAQRAVPKIVEQRLRGNSIHWSVGQCQGVCRIGTFCDGQVCAAGVGPEHGARACTEGHSCRALCDRWGDTPARSGRHCGFHTRSGRDRKCVLEHPHAATQRLDLGGRADELDETFLIAVLRSTREELRTQTSFFRAKNSVLRYCVAPKRHSVPAFTARAWHRDGETAARRTRRDRSGRCARTRWRNGAGTAASGSPRRRIEQFAAACAARAGESRRGRGRQAPRRIPR